MQTNLSQTDSFAGGTFSPANFNPPAGSIGDAAIQAGAKVSASKLQHQYEKQYSQEGATNAAVERRVVHVVVGATGSVIDFKVGAVTPAIGAATATFDLYKNGGSILTGAVSLTSSTAAYALLAGTLASPGLVTGDVLEILVTAAVAGGGTLAKGLFARVQIREDAQ